MGARYVDGFVKGLGPLTDNERPTKTCDSCGREVAVPSRRIVSAATCSWCVPQGPVRGRREERLARRKSGVRK